MAARALAAAGRRLAGGRAGPPLLASCRNGASTNHCYSASAQREEEQMTTGEQVEAALNSKNVEVLDGEENVATVLPDETIDLGGGGAGAGEDVSWVPDEETGVFVPADADTDTAATHGPPGAADAAMPMPTEGGSVLDQTVFVREEEMEDVERPAIDMARANAIDSSKKNY